MANDTHPDLNMANSTREKPALLIIDMVKDNLDPANHFPITAMDALCHDFKAVLVEDSTTAFSEKIHDRTLAIYRHNPLYPLLKVTSSQTLLADLGVSP